MKIPLVPPDDTTSGNGSDPPEPPAPPSPNAFPFEVLRTMHSGSLKRWENRREQEWKLNYAVWTALAAFIAGIVLAVKDVEIRQPADWIVCGAGLILFGAHFLYLWPMTSRGIAEIEMQADAEKAMNEMLPFRKLNTKNFGGGIHGHWPIEKRYGLVAPLAITAFLLAVTGWLLLNPPRKISDDKPKQINLNYTPPAVPQPVVPAQSVGGGAGSKNGQR
jgi:hypothetical protein